MAAYQRQSQGFSLVELMISLAIGLIVVSAVLAFTLSSLTANSEYVQSTRLSQELRNTMDFVSRELRRAGYDENMNRYTAASTMNALTISPFARIFVDDDVNNDGLKNDGCVIYAYDRTGGTPGTVERTQGEIRALRLAFYQAATATSTPMTIRQIGVGLQGQLRQSADGTVTRGISSSIRVRADCLEASANCALPPTGT